MSREQIKDEVVRMQLGEPRRLCDLFRAHVLWMTCVPLGVDAWVLVEGRSMSLSGSFTILGSAVFLPKDERECEAIYLTRDWCRQRFGSVPHTLSLNPDTGVVYVCLNIWIGA